MAASTARDGLLAASVTVTTAEVLELLGTNRREWQAHVIVGRIMRAIGWTRRQSGKGPRRHSRYTPPVVACTP